MVFWAQSARNGGNGNLSRIPAFLRLTLQSRLNWQLAQEVAIAIALYHFGFQMLDCRRLVAIAYSPLGMKTAKRGVSLALKESVRVSA
jgi:hypothetical protein